MKDCFYAHYYQPDYSQKVYRCKYCKKIGIAMSQDEGYEPLKLGVLLHQEMEGDIECDARKLAEALE